MPSWPDPLEPSAKMDVAAVAAVVADTVVAMRRTIMMTGTRRKTGSTQKTDRVANWRGTAAGGRWRS